jgi:hypothetical protein
MSVQIWFGYVYKIHCSVKMKYINVYLVVAETCLWVVRVTSVQILFDYVYKIQSSVQNPS